ncbi:hypothetical protein BJV82DRAFT_363134 [Fennellomyces sp. T-0311]|nr:hypothetical protein BJV82DRAFT_363134 [Fennellomyces sp. T-0311]
MRMFKPAACYSKLLRLLRDHPCSQGSFCFYLFVIATELTVLPGWPPSVVFLFNQILDELPNNVFVQHNFDKHQERAKALVDLAQESILLYPYKSVPALWRHLLMDASILQTIGILGRLGHDRHNMRLGKEIIEVLDTAMIISGAPQRRDTILDVIDQLQTWLSIASKEEWDDVQLPMPHSVTLKHQVKRLTEVPSFVSFAQLVNDDQPFVIPKGAIEHWPARSKWPSLSYFVAVAGDRVVPVELGSKYTDSGWQQKMMRLEDFLRDHVVDTTAMAYLAQHDLFYQIPKLANDIDVPDYCCCEPELTERYPEAPPDVIQNAWFGPRGTVSPLHHDPYHNVLVQVVGSKYIRLYPPSETERLYPYDGIMSNTSQVDVECPDWNEHPLLKKAHYVECVLQAGELLYMPPKWWHYVRSLETSFSVSFWF